MNENEFVEQPAQAISWSTWQGWGRADLGVGPRYLFLQPGFPILYSPQDPSGPKLWVTRS